MDMTTSGNQCISNKNDSEMYSGLKISITLLRQQSLYVDEVREERMEEWDQLKSMIDLAGRFISKYRAFSRVRMRRFVVSGFWKSSLDLYLKSI